MGKKAVGPEMVSPASLQDITIEVMVRCWKLNLNLHHQPWLSLAWPSHFHHFTPRWCPLAVKNGVGAPISRMK